MKTTKHWKGIPHHSKALLAFGSLLMLGIASSPAHSSDLLHADLYRVQWEAAPLQAPAPQTQSQQETAHDMSTRRRISRTFIGSGGSGYGMGDSNEQFNRLWLQSFHPSASHYEGEKAGRKLVQMWAKSIWKQVGAKRYKTADYLVEHLDASNAYKPHYGKQKNDLDYRLSVSDDDVELKLHYSFY